jgi:hypothetical protein
VIEEGESPLAPETVVQLEDFVDRHLPLIETIGSYELYELQGVFEDR